MLPAPTSFFVHLLESSRPDEYHSGFSEAMALEQVLKFASVQHEKQYCASKSDFTRALQHIVHLNKWPAVLPVLHISAHGFEDGIALTSKEILTSNELGHMLTSLHQITNGSYLLCMSSCRGLAAIKQAFANGPPTFGIVGTLRDVNWSDNIIGFAAFYHLLQKGNSIHNAVAG